MTTQEKYRHVASGKFVLKARRKPKQNIWEITYYNLGSYNIWSWDRFDTKELCEEKIKSMVAESPNKFVAEIEPGVEAGQNA